MSGTQLGFTHAVIDAVDGETYAGAVQEVVLAGARFIKLTVPSGQMRFFSGATIEGITPCDEDFADRLGKQLRQPLDRIYVADETAEGASTVDDVIWQAGYEDGHSVGYQEGFIEGEASGYDQGVAEKDGGQCPACGYGIRPDARQGVLLPGDEGFNPPEDLRAA